jgi:hypothetical protein
MFCLCIGRWAFVQAQLTYTPARRQLRSPRAARPGATCAAQEQVPRELGPLQDGGKLCQPRQPRLLLVHLSHRPLDAEQSHDRVITRLVEHMVGPGRAGWCEGQVCSVPSAWILSAPPALRSGRRPERSPALPLYAMIWIRIQGIPALTGPAAWYSAAVGSACAAGTAPPSPCAPRRQRCSGSAGGAS